MAKLATLRSMSGHDRLLFLEAVFLLAVARFCVRFLKFRHYAGLLGPQCDGEMAKPVKADQETSEEIQAIGQEIKRAANNVPWQSVCLPQAIAGKWMLKRRGITSDLYLGLAKDESTNLKAHAWLVAGDVPVTGVASKESFTQVARFC